MLLGGIWFGTLLVVGAKLRGVRRIILVVREISTFLIVRRLDLFDREHRIG